MAVTSSGIMPETNVGTPEQTRGPRSRIDHAATNTTNDNTDDMDQSSSSPTSMFSPRSAAAVALSSICRQAVTTTSSSSGSSSSSLLLDTSINQEVELSSSKKSLPPRCNDIGNINNNGSHEKKSEDEEMKTKTSRLPYLPDASTPNALSEGMTEGGLNKRVLLHHPPAVLAQPSRHVQELQHSSRIMSIPDIMNPSPVSLRPTTHSGGVSYSATYQPHVPTSQQPHPTPHHHHHHHRSQNGMQQSFHSPWTVTGGPLPPHPPSASSLGRHMVGMGPPSWTRTPPSRGPPPQSSSVAYHHHHHHHHNYQQTSHTSHPPPHGGPLPPPPVPPHNAGIHPPPPPPPQLSNAASSMMMSHSYPSYPPPSSWEHQPPASFYTTNHTNNNHNNSDLTMDAQHPSSTRKNTRPSSLQPQSMVTPTPKKPRIDPSYNRKKKSLGLLAETFLSRYAASDHEEEVVIDKLAQNLAVERRRIYDVVNILESLRIVVKKGKNTYHWMGIDHLPSIFAILQNDAISEYPEDALEYGLIAQADPVCASTSDAGDGATTASASTSRSSSGKDTKSLCLLSQYFVQCFLVGHEIISLPEASDKIHRETSTMEELAILGSKRTAVGVPSDPRKFQQAAMRGLKTKIRRLYDIANVFVSVGIIAKVDDKAVTCTASRPCFRWTYQLGPSALRELYHQLPPEVKSTRSPFVVGRHDPPSSQHLAFSPPDDQEDMSKGQRPPLGDYCNNESGNGVAAVTGMSLGVAGHTHHHSNHQATPSPDTCPSVLQAANKGNSHATTNDGQSTQLLANIHVMGGAWASAQKNPRGDEPRRVSLGGEGNLGRS